MSPLSDGAKVRSPARAISSDKAILWVPRYSTANLETECPIGRGTLTLLKGSNGRPSSMQRGRSPIWTLETPASTVTESGGKLTVSSQFHMGGGSGPWIAGEALALTVRVINDSAITINVRLEVCLEGIPEIEHHQDRNRLALEWVGSLLEPDAERIELLHQVLGDHARFQPTGVIYRTRH